MTGANPISGVARREIRFLAVIVLYKMAPNDSAALRSLYRAASRLSPGLASLEILLYDNTPGAAERPNLPPEIAYHAAGSNQGLPSAFNFALDLAETAGCGWLITLDQDTVLPPDFLTQIAGYAEALQPDFSVAAIVPQITGEGRKLSPNWFFAGAWPRWFPEGYVGVPPHPVYAFNSASTLRVSALRDIGGYDRWFWLDNCDSALYHQLHRHGKKVFVAGNIQVDHHFSMLDRDARMSAERYHNLLLTESAFWDLHMNALAGLERTARLGGRWLKHRLYGGKPEFRRETALALKRRLFSSRAARIAAWRRETVSMFPSLEGPSAPPAEQPNARATTPVTSTAAALSRLSVPLADAATGGKPRSSPLISVIIVNWNGKQFLDACLTSLRRQTFPDFETILVDNGSKDGSLDYVRQNFPEVRAIALGSNFGFSGGNNAGFEHARGDLIVLLNNDTAVHPEWLEQIEKAATRFPRAGSFACKMLYFDDRTRIENCGFDVSLAGATLEVGRDQSDGPEWAEPREVFGACGGAAVYRRSMLEKIGFFDPDFFLIYEDVDLAFRAQLSGFACVYTPGAVVYHRYRASIGTLSPTQVFYSQRNIELVYWKNMPMSVLMRSLPQRLLYEFGAAAYFIKAGAGRDFVSAKAEAVRFLTAALKSRKRIQQHRAITDAQLLGLMKRAPLAAKWKKLLSLWKPAAAQPDPFAIEPISVNSEASSRRR